MIIPLHDNRFFSSMAQVFERLARERKWYPIVVSTLRQPALELETVTDADLLPDRIPADGAAPPIPINRRAAPARPTASPTSMSTCREAWRLR